MEEKRTANTEIKKANRTAVYQLLYQEPETTKQDIVIRLGLSLPTISMNLQELEEEGLIQKSGSVGNTGGRRAVCYSVIPDARTAIGLDITRNHITAVAVDLKGEIISKIRIRYPFSREEKYYQELGHVVETVIEDAKLNREHILGVSIGVPGLITQDNKSVFYGKILNFTGATCEEFAQYIDFPVKLYNDANAAVFAEAWANQSIDNAFYIMLSNNVGGAIYIDNQTYCGDNIKSGEVGHITIHPDGKSCYCGQKGCVDAYCAATVLSDYTDGNLSEFFKQLKNGDPEKKMIWETYLKDVALTVNNVRMLFDCTVILGGYVGEYIEEYLFKLRELAQSINPFDSNADYLVACKYKTEAIAAGASLNYIAEFVNQI